MGATKRTGGRQQGAQVHDEGQHGDKTQKHIAGAWNHPGGNETAGGANVAEPDDMKSARGPHYDPAVEAAHSPPANSHIFNDRTQHDEADLNSEKTRLVRATERDKQIGSSELDKRSAQASAKRKS